MTFQGQARAAIPPILGLHPVLDDFELEWPDSPEQWDALTGVLELKCLHHASCNSWLSPSRNRLNWAVLGLCSHAKHSGVNRGISWYNQRWILRQGVADTKLRMTDQPDHIPGISFVDRLAVPAKKFV
jgi:hypothetical protein